MGKQAMFQPWHVEVLSGQMSEKVTAKDYIWRDTFGAVHRWPGGKQLKKKTSQWSAITAPPATM